MRQWRVGTVSMGASLILLGCFLFLSQMKGIAVMDTLVAWWPLILIVLGIEVLFFVYFSKKKHPYVKYDVFSILFVGMIGFLSIGFVLLTGTGMMGEVRHAISAERHTTALPEVRESIPAEVERIVLQTNGQHVGVEGTDAEEMTLFGTYSMVTSHVRKPSPLKTEDIVAMQTVGSTMYVTIKPLPHTMGLFQHEPSVDVTVALPETMSVEVRGAVGSLELNPGELQNDWFVQNGGHVTVNLPGSGDIELSAVTHDDVLQGNAEWTNVKGVRRSHSKDSGEEDDEDYTYTEEMYRGTVKVGKGSYRLHILESDALTVNVLN